MNTTETLKPEIRTNRDIYLFVTALRENASDRSLADYLSALWLLAREHRDAPAVDGATFAQLLRDAFTAPVEPQPPAPAAKADEGYGAFEMRILWQIRDLVEMEAAGSLDNDMRYFGINSPRGARWYNFDPFTFLECGVAGSFDGWEPGDPGGRDFVPGDCVALDADGNLVTVAPQDVERSVDELNEITWEEFTDFLWCGQEYE